MPGEPEAPRREPVADEIAPATDGGRVRSWLPAALRRRAAATPAGEDSDDALMARVASGDADAFRSLTRRYLGRMVALGTRTLGDAVEAEDVAQESFLRLWKQAPSWRPGEAKVGTWLHKVALNLCLDRLAKRREEIGGDVPERSDPAPGPARTIAGRQTADHVNAALARLPDAQRAAITLCHYQDMRNIEAAEVMGVSIEALESLLARGRRKLREELRAVAPELLEEA